MISNRRVNRAERARWTIKSGSITNETFTIEIYGGCSGKLASTALFTRTGCLLCSTVITTAITSRFTVITSFTGWVEPELCPSRHSIPSGGTFRHKKLSQAPVETINLPATLWSTIHLDLTEESSPVPREFFFQRLPF